MKKQRKGYTPEEKVVIHNGKNTVYTAESRLRRG
jgi:hypothetical protein